MLWDWKFLTASWRRTKGFYGHACTKGNIFEGLTWSLWLIPVIAIRIRQITQKLQQISFDRWNSIPALITHNGSALMSSASCSNPASNKSFWRPQIDIKNCLKWETYLKEFIKPKSIIYPILPNIIEMTRSLFPWTNCVSPPECII